MRIIALSVMGVLAGCASSEPPAPIPPSPPLNLRVAPPLEAATPIQTSRYVLERRGPASQLTDMLDVPVDARMPAMANLTVKDGLDFLLTGSGMRVRTPTSYGESQMYAQPLPVTQMDMGQIPLRHALQVLGGQAFELEEDVVKREVGFRLKNGYVWTPPKYDEIQPTAQLDKALTANRTGLTSSTHSDLDNDAFFSSDTVTRAASLNNNTVVASNQQSVASAKTVLSSGKSVTNSHAKPMTVKTFAMVEGESYRDAILRWANSAGFEKVALAQDLEFLNALDSRSPSGFLAKGSLRTAVAKLAEEIPELSELTLYENSAKGLAALHPYRMQAVTVFMTNGKTLEAVIEDAVKQYDWNWDADHSWGADNYAFGTAYPVVTRKTDISGALSILLKQYPLEARRLDANRTIYIREATPL
ncbi:hypothetical protein [Vibrio scophthalmi]|uniref:Toxin co-regulated pilus biosynthesis protein Q C-terminal domain-containing protein n=1 Tax=Vibrio scophthalmi TaxID=45658 RepID=A0A1C7FK68_9VIBR|nr:hypothetical protein [Vibrio scophthalmi]ANU39409.1 hypothetical protein VSVS05_04374 [Vibrio scophthalmi]